MEAHTVSVGQIQDASKRVRDYTMPTDFCKVFNDHLDHSYTLSLLLTTDHHKAAPCFMAALDDCLHGNAVVREWAQSWATRTVIKNAIRIISPSRNGTKRTAENCDLTEPASEADTPQAAITKLQPFDRFVYAMSVLEKYSDRECSILLDCTVEDIARARTQSLQRLLSVVSLEGREALDLAASA